MTQEKFMISFNFPLPIKVDLLEISINIRNKKFFKFFLIRKTNKGERRGVKKFPYLSERTFWFVPDQYHCFRLGPPSQPGNISIDTQEEDCSKLTLRWSPPSNNGSLPLEKYHIKCENCPTGYKIENYTTALQLELKVGCYAKYDFTVSSENDISRKTGHWGVARKSLQTKEGRTLLYFSLRCCFQKILCIE